MKLIVDIMNTKVEFDERDEYLKGEFIKQAHQKLGAREQGFIHNPRYKAGVWDGIIDFYNITDDTFPTGLLNLMEELLGDMQSQYGFQYEIIDDRPDPFLYPEDMSKEITLKDNNVGEITLRNYQYNAVKSIIESYTGITHIATNGGKCISKDSKLLTPNGYKSLEQIFNEQSVSVDSSEDTIPMKYPLINRYGEIEYTSHFTKNGKKKTKQIKTNRGIVLTNTYNHPLLVLKGKEFKWVNTEDIKVGDILIGNKGSDMFGNDDTVKSEDEAYALGCMIADSYLGSHDRLAFSNDKKELIEHVSEFWSTFSDRGTYYDTHHKSKGITIFLHDKHKSNSFHEKYGIGYGVAKDKRVPECIKRSPKNIQLAFLSGYIECECHISNRDTSMEIVSASKELLEDIQLMLFNLGIDNKFSEKVVKNYEHNFYGKLTIKTRELAKLLKLLSFKTEQRKQQKDKVINKEFKSQYGNKIYGLRKELTEFRNSLDIDRQEFKKYISRDSISIDKINELLSTYSGGKNRELFEKLSQETISYQEVIDIVEGEYISTFDVCMPKTHSFISNSIVNHNTEIASGLMQEILPFLERGERIAFFTDKKEIFEQSALRIQERLGIEVGMIGGGKKDIKQVTFVMIPTVNANLKDPEKGVKLTAKEQLYKKIAKQVLPKFEGGKNQRKLLGMYIQRFEPKTKADLKLLEELQNIYDTCGSDNSVLMRLRNYNAMYTDTVRKKNKKVFEKHEYIREFLDSVAVMICDEAHHTGSDTWYNSLMSCKNAQYRVGLTGSIDKKNELLNMRLNALFGGVISRVENDYLINEGHSAKPTIRIFPVSAPKNIEKENQYQTAYDKGIVNNEYRNTLIAKLGNLWYTKDKGVLIIVNHIKHGENISELLDKLEVEHYFIHGELDDDTRRQKLQDMRTGKLKVMIATSIVDEGVDISGIHALILAAGGKSLRQTLQRVGRALRKKKDDNTCQVFDFTDYTNKFLLSHSKERRKIYIDEKFDIVDIQPKN